MRLVSIIFITFLPFCFCSETQFSHQRLSLPCEGLIFQNFDNFPAKKGAWYTTEVDHFTLTPSPKGSFRSPKGLILQGAVKGPQAQLRVPLNPDHTARPIKALSIHKGRVMLRANCRGLIRYSAKDSLGNIHYSAWQKFYSSPKESLGQKPQMIINQYWAAQWRHIEFSELGELGKVLTPHEIEVRLPKNITDFIIHLDEFILDTDFMLESQEDSYQLMPCHNLWPQEKFPHPAFTFAMHENWQLCNTQILTQLINPQMKCQNGNLKIQYQWNGKAPLMKEALSETIEIPFIPENYPIHLATHKGVVGLRLTLKSSGITHAFLKLNFSEQRIRSLQQSSLGSQPEREIFSTRIPLDFTGRRVFDIPLSFLGLPVRSQYRKHNKKIDGHLKLDSLLIIHQTQALKQSPQEHSIEVLQVEEWSHKKIWQDHYPYLAVAQNNLKTPHLNSYKTKASEGVLIHNMNDAIFNSTIKKSRNTGEIQLQHIPQVAIMGERACQIHIPSKKANEAVDLQVQLSINKQKRSIHTRAGLQAHQMAAHIISSHKGFISYLVEDQNGLIFASPPSPFPAWPYSLKAELPYHKKLSSRIFFEPLQQERSKYRDIKGNNSNIAFPVFPSGFQITYPKHTGHADIILDDIIVWDSFHKTKLGRAKLATVKPYYYDAQQLHTKKFFSQYDGWHISKLSTAIAAKPLFRITADAEQKALDKITQASLKYQEAFKKWQTLKSLDPDSEKTTEDFLPPSAKVSQLGTMPLLNQFQSGTDHLFFDITWQEQDAPKEWCHWGGSEVCLDTVIPLKDNPAYIPLHKGVIGLRLKLFHSAHSNTYLRISFEDEEKRIFTRYVPLESPGQFVYDLFFDNLNFEITTRRGARVQLEKAPQKLRLYSLALQHKPLSAQHGGQQSIKLYEADYIIDRRVMKTIPFAVRK
ncbi:MAG: hypothetical protein HQL32_09670 [Planctomycetes bacterium]|nr:hypothetical protein [Planctomycetota bacterium]